MSIFLVLWIALGWIPGLAAGRWVIKDISSGFVDLETVDYFLAFLAFFAAWLAAPALLVIVPLYYFVVRLGPIMFGPRKENSEEIEV